MNNKIIFYILVVVIVSIPSSIINATKKIQWEISSDCRPTKRQSTQDYITFETLPKDMRIIIVKRLEDENTIRHKLARLASVSRSFHRLTLDALLTCSLYFFDHPKLNPHNINVLRKYGTIDINLSSSNDTAMEKITQLGNVKTLTTLSCHFTKEGFNHLSKCTTLKKLSLMGTLTQSVDDYEGALTSLTKIDTLIIADINDITGLFPLIHRLTWLDSLCIHTKCFKDDCMTFLNKSTKLRSLSLKGTSVTDAMIPHLKDLTNLTSLGVGKTAVTDNAKLEIKKVLPKVSIIF